MKFTPIETGISFLPRVGLLFAGAIVSGALMPRTGPRPLVPVGCVLDPDAAVVAVS
jgi:hypothetical protein